MAHDNLRDQIGELIVEGTADQTEAERRRVIEEILDLTETYQEAPGPEGPWYYRSLTIYRVNNQIFVNDVDSLPAETFYLPSLDVSDKTLVEKLIARLDEIHQKTLEKL